MRVIEADRTESTMRDARDAIARHEVDEPTLFVAREQTGGVGRHGRAWSSPRGGLWMTVVVPLPPGELRGVLDGLGLRAGVAITDTLSLALVRLAASMGGSDSGPSTPSPLVQLKWPNDVYLNGKKVAGLLTETTSAMEHPYLLLGLGVNANFPTSDLPGDLRERATTILAELGAPVKLGALRDDLADALLDAAHEHSVRFETIQRARGLLYGVNQPVRITSGAAREPMTGTLMGLSDRGLPLVRTDRGVEEASPGSELG